MTYDDACDVLRREGWLQPNGDIQDDAHYISCKVCGPCAGYCVLDGNFEIDQLEAIAVYMRRHESRA